MLELLSQYGYWGVFAVVLIVQLGAPLPVLPLFLLVGSFALHDPVLGLLSLGAAVIASLIGDTVWYLAGRRYKQHILQLLCRISISPDSCVRQTEGAFHRWGVATLVVAKFIPGLATLTPPLAGALGLGRGVFFLFSLIGAALWAGVWMLLGALFNQQIHLLLGYMQAWGKGAMAVMVSLLLLYLLYLWWQRYSLRLLAKVARVTVHELAEWLQQQEQPLVLDARSKLARDLDTVKISGAQLFDATALRRSVRQLQPVHAIVVYCSCPNDVTALRVAGYLRRKGFQAHVLSGGLDAWKQAGFVLEPDVVVTARRSTV